MLVAKKGAENMDNRLILNKDKLNVALANKCLNPYEFCKFANIGYSTYKRMAVEQPIKPKTAGKVAKALGCKVEDLLDD